MPGRRDTLAVARAEASRRLVNLYVARDLPRLLRAARLPESELAALRLRKLRRLLIHAYRRHEFYRDLMTQARFRPERLQSIDELERLPVVDRSLYRQFTEAELARHPDLYAHFFRDRTSGSTGQPVPIVRTWRERGYMLAKFLSLAVRSGYRPWHSALWIPPPTGVRRRDTWLQRLGLLRRAVIPFSEPTDRLVDGFLRTRPDFVFANKSHLVQMALHMARRGRPEHRPRLCVSVGEVLDETSRALIEEVFRPHRLLDVYGALEFSSLAFRQPARDASFTFCHATDILELGDRDPGSPHVGAAVVTDLHIASFPLIRYGLGDRIEIEPGPGLPRVRRIVGRQDDVLVLADGTTCAGPLVEVIMEEHPEILQYRLAQTALDQVVVSLVARDRTDRSVLEAALAQAFRTRIGESLRCRFEWVDLLPPDPTGKLRMLTSARPPPGRDDAGAPSL